MSSKTKNQSSEIPRGKVPSPKATPKITLYPFQQVHDDFLKRTLAKFPYVIDKSVPGSGKTYTTTKYAIDAGFKHVIVVCPNSMISKWEGMKIYGLPIHQVINFESLRSVKNKTPKHGLLTRLDMKKGSKDATFFYPTSLYLDMVSEGLLLVIDEIQNIKNETHQNKACKALCDSITGSFTSSKVMLLSGAPGDKIEHYVNLMRMVGIIKNPKLCIYHKGDKFLEYLGFKELVDFCSKVNSPSTDICLEQYPPNKANLKEVAYQLYLEILNDKISGSMDTPHVSINCYSGYFSMSEPDIELCNEAIDTIQRGAKYSKLTGTSDMSRANWSEIGRGIAMYEFSIVNTYIRLARAKLREDPNCKVVIGLGNTTPFKLICNALQKYNPACINGDVAQKLRPGICAKFQEDNNDCRVAVFNTICINSGIDLDCKTGRHPRYVLMTPSYRIDVLHQLSRRFARIDSKSTPTVNTVYPQQAKFLKSIINSLIKKTEIYKQTLEKQVKSGVIFPGEYPVFTEEPRTLPEDCYDLIKVRDETDVLEDLDEFIKNLSIEDVFVE